MDNRDLLNLMRHAYLIGWNAGMHSERDKEYESCFDERDADLQSFIDDYHEQGAMGYNDDNGSHVCSEDTCGTKSLIDIAKEVREEIPAEEWEKLNG